MTETSHKADRADLVLASRSPRRLELVRRLGLDVDVRPSDIPEERGDDESPVAYTERLAEQKAADVADALEGGESSHPAWMIAADTIVVFEGEVLEKPESPERAREMLQRMTGRWHEVVTSYCVYDRRSRQATVRTERTDVRMRDLPATWIARYVATGEPMDKAGSYGIQDFGALLVDELDGSYFNVVGLPIAELVRTFEALEAFDVHPILEPEDADDIDV